MLWRQYHYACQTLAVGISDKNCVRNRLFSVFSYANRTLAVGISDKNCVRNRLFSVYSYANRTLAVGFSDKNCVRNRLFEVFSYANRTLAVGISALVNKNWTRTSSIMYLLEPIIMHGCCLNGHPCTVWVSCS